VNLLKTPKKDDRKGQRAVAKFCEPCPVKNECLDAAIMNLERGVWGGTSYKQREGIRRQREDYKPKNGRQGTTHGTVAGAKYHYSFGELPCDECREAYSEFNKLRKANRQNPEST
jgi:hypothetical protein